MSFDIVVSLALFVGAALLMMRFGCGAHMGHARRARGSAARHAGAGSGVNDGVGLASPNGGASVRPARGQTAERSRREGCC